MQEELDKRKDGEKLEVENKLKYVYLEVGFLFAVMKRIIKVFFLDFLFN